MKSFINEKPVKGRQCGECQACCSRLTIPILNKPERVPCKHLCSTGCGIYQDRPQVCSEFQCMWLQGWMGGESHRPDKLGIMFTPYEHNGEQVIQAWGLQDEISEKVMKIFVELGRLFTFVYLAYNGQQRLVGKVENNQKFLEVHSNDSRPMH
jgi:hypothetical protein